jgi:hypothetical protein
VLLQSRLTTIVLTVDFFGIVVATCDRINRGCLLAFLRNPDGLHNLIHCKAGIIIGVALSVVFRVPLLQFNSRRMDRCVGGRASCTGLDLGCFLSISCPLTPGIRLYGVEVDETGDTMDSKKRQENQGFPTNP